MFFEVKWTSHPVKGGFFMPAIKRATDAVEKIFPSPVKYDIVALSIGIPADKCIERRIGYDQFQNRLAGK